VGVICKNYTQRIELYLCIVTE